MSVLKPFNKKRDTKTMQRDNVNGTLSKKEAIGIGSSSSVDVRTTMLTSIHDEDRDLLLDEHGSPERSVLPSNMTLVGEEQLLQPIMSTPPTSTSTTTGTTGSYKIGDLVEVFFNTNHWQLGGYRRALLHNMNPGSGANSTSASPTDDDSTASSTISSTTFLRATIPPMFSGGKGIGPVWGKTQGWVGGRVAEVGEDGKITVLLDGEFEEAMSRRRDRNLLWRAEPQDVRPVGQEYADPVVSLLVVRWWDYHSHKQKNEYKITSEFAVRTFVENSGIKDLLGTRFEIFSVFVRYSEDLDVFDPHQVYDLMSGFHKVGLYYLWPVQKRNAHELAGMVEERRFFNMLEKAEDAGIDTRYPAPLHLYRQLCGKLYYNAACLNKDLQTPITTRVLASNIKKDPVQAAKNAVQALNEIRRRVYGPNEKEITSGVIKLGFSWMGVDVKAWQSVEELATKLTEMMFHANPNQIGTSLLVQELVVARVVELRVHVFPVLKNRKHIETNSLEIDLATAEWEWDFQIRYMTLYDNEHEGITMTSARNLGSDEVLGPVFKNDKAAQDKAEEQAKLLTERWLAWYRSEWGVQGCPNNGRFDFLVSWDPEGKEGGPTDPVLWTCEMTECGASLCGLPIEARNTAIANSCLTTGSGGPKVKPLPWVDEKWGVKDDDMWAFMWPHGTSLWGPRPPPPAANAEVDDEDEGEEL